MQAVEDFMREFFCARIVEEQREMVSRAPFRQKFYAHECQADSRAGTLERLQSVEVVSVTESDSEAVVIMVFKNDSYKPGNQMHRERYQLKPAGDSWLIQSVEMECPACHGLGDETCIFCKGKHWR
jgi:hypothetical protein